MATTTTLPLTFTLLFFFFFTSSSARISLPLRLPPNYVSNPFPHSNSDQTILLPTQNLESLNSDPSPLKPATFLPAQKIASSNPTPPLPGQRPGKSKAIIQSQNLDSSHPTTILLPGQKAKPSNPTNIFPSQKSVSANPTDVFPNQKPELVESTTIPQERKQKPTILPNQELEPSQIFTTLSGQKPEVSDPANTIIPCQKLDLAEPETILPPDQKAADPASVLELELKPETTTKSQPQTSNNEPKGIEQEMPPLSDTISIETLHLNPLTYIRIRSINRHYRVNPSLFRIHRCHHHHHHHIIKKRNEDPHSDAMIMAGRTIERLEPSILRGSVRPNPVKWDIINHYKHVENGSMMNRHAFKHYMFAKLKRKAEENQRTKDQEERKKGGFMMKFRKFLNHI